MMTESCKTAISAKRASSAKLAGSAKRAGAAERVISAKRLISLALALVMTVGSLTLFTVSAAAVSEQTAAAQTAAQVTATIDEIAEQPDASAETTQATADAPITTLADAETVNVSDHGDEYYYYGRKDGEFLAESLDMTALDGWTLGKTTVGFGSSSNGNTLASVIPSGSGPNQRGDLHTWTYFKKSFIVPDEFDLAAISGATGAHIIDDALIIYLNGVEIYNYNTSTVNDGEGPVNIGEARDWGRYPGSNTEDYNRAFAIDGDYNNVGMGSGSAHQGGSPDVRHAASLTNLKSALVIGENVITCVVGQRDSGSSDLFFSLDFDIAAETGGEVVPPTVDKTELIAAIAAAEALLAGDYTADSWNELQRVLKTVKEVAENPDANQAQVTASLFFVNNAVAALLPSETLEYSDVLISLGDDESELMFTWYTAQETGKIAYREQGAEAFAEVLAANGGSDANRTHKAVLSGLKANAVYEYMLLGEENTSSKIFTVKTGNPDAFRFIAVGDPQIGSSNTVNDTAGWVNTLNRVSAAFPDASFLLSAGDQVENANNVGQYTGYLKPEQLKNLPTSQTVGNHDTGNALYTDHYSFPNSVSVGSRVTNIDYWYTYGGALFMHIDANVSSFAAHKDFLEGAIAANPDADWKIVVFHQGPYTNASHDDNDGLGFRKNWSPQFNELGIDVVLNGHDHSYTRAYQMLNDNPQYEQNWLDENDNLVSDPTGKLYNKVLNPTGTAYIEMNSGSGSKFYGLKPEQYFVAKQVQTNTPNFSVVDIDGDSFTITTYALNARYDGAEHEVIDTYTIKKDDEFVPPTPYDGVIANVETGAESDASKPIEYAVSLEGAKDVSVVTLVFEADGNMLNVNRFEAQNGFSAMSDNIAWTHDENMIYTGRLTLVYTPYGKNFTAADKTEILRIYAAAKQLGETTVKLVDAVIVEGVTDGEVEWKFGANEAKTDIVEVIVYSTYDLNRDTFVDEKDLSIILGYYLISSEDPEWEYAQAADYGGTEGEIDLADVTAVYANFTPRA